MLNINTGSIYYYNEPINMHKSFNGLSILVQDSFPGQLLTGAYFVFINRRRNQLKVFFWDYDGLVVWHKRLEKGSFKIDKNGSCKLTRREFFMILEGIEPRRLNRRFQLPEK